MLARAPPPKLELVEAEIERKREREGSLVPFSQPSLPPRLRAPSPRCSATSECNRRNRRGLRVRTCCVCAPRDVDPSRTYLRYIHVCTVYIHLHIPCICNLYDARGMILAWWPPNDSTFEDTRRGLLLREAMCIHVKSSLARIKTGKVRIAVTWFGYKLYFIRRRFLENKSPSTANFFDHKNNINDINYVMIH